jgi:hypothetical protein
MKKLFPLLMVLMLMSILAFSQNTETSKPPVKNSQASLYNDFYAGYGALSIFYFTGRMKHSSDYPTETGLYTYTTSSDKRFTEPQSVGTIYLGFARSLNRVVSVGFMFGYQNFHYTGTAHIITNGNDSVLKIINDDRLVTGTARLTFCYLSKPYVRMYSGIGIGLTIDFGRATVNGEQTTERKLWPGGQLTLMGLRVGRAFGGFLEFGFGSYGIVNAGLSYKFSD